MDRQPPDPDAYGRVTDPERYRTVVDAAESLIDDLVETFRVVRSTGDSAVDFPERHAPSQATIRLVPEQGVPISFALTDFPGVLLRFGTVGADAFPRCGCDACDEAPDEAVDQMTRLVWSLVAGDYREEVTRREVRFTFGGASVFERREERRRWGWHRRPRRRRVREWPPWSRRS
jgi:hypothetical protein